MSDPHNKLEVVRVDGNDTDIALAARICFGKKYVVSDTVDRVIRSLLRGENKHFTPFEWGRFWFYIRCSRDCHSQFLQYRTASRLTRSLRRVQPIELEEMLEVPDYMNFGLSTYTNMVESGKHKEDARKALPLDTLTEFYWYIDLRNLMHFLKERNNPEAQDEIRELAIKMEEEFRKKFPVSYKGWKEFC